MGVFLHVGCGGASKKHLKGFNSDEWKEIRFDIDKKVNPDIVGTLTDMSLVESSSVDAIYSSHNIEHIYPHEIPRALKEFHRVLKPEGIVVITCPDLQTVCEAVAKDKLVEPLYVSPAGPISAIDILIFCLDIEHRLQEAMNICLTSVGSHIRFCRIRLCKRVSRILSVEEGERHLICG